MAQVFAARVRFEFSNGAIGWRPGGMMDCLGPYAKVENCPIFTWQEKDGRQQLVDTGHRYTCYATWYADTYFSVPAATRIGGVRVTGFFTQKDGGCEFNAYKGQQIPFPEPKLEVVELEPNGDPFGRGYTGSLTTDGGQNWVYLGGCGAQSREWWRRYARQHGYVLREVRS